MENPFAGATGKEAITRRLPGVPEATIQDYIDDAWAKATSVAPCIALDTFPPDNKPEKAAELTAILRGIILRWHQVQSGSVQSQSRMAGPYQQQISLNPQPRRGWALQPSEVLDLQGLCKRQGQAFSFDTIPEDFEVKPPLYGVVVNGSTEGLHGPDGEWSDEVL